MVETETGLKVKCLSSDNGGEYIDGGFSEYCTAQGFRMEKIIPRTPHTTTYLINRGPSVPWSSDFLMRLERSSRNIRPPQRYSPILNYLLLTDCGEPKCYDEALQYENSSKWELAMKDEMDSLLGNQTWELTELLVGKKALHNKFQQKEGIDYTEIFSPVVKMSTIRLVLGMVAVENLHLEQLDVKTTFLHGDLEEDLYMIQPEGFDIEENNNLKKQLSKKFAMKDLGAAKQILAKPVSTPLGSHFKLSKEQSPKTEEEMDHMSKVPYASAISSLMYAMVCTRPDIARAVGVVSRFMSRPGKQHREAVKWILRYLKGSLDTCFCFTSASLKLQGYVDADFVVILIVERVLLEADYVAATKAGKEMIWLHCFLDELGKKQEMGILHSDSQNKLVVLEKICGSKNPTDMLTKGVTIEKLKLCAASIGLLA
ncbi:Retrovirus-related Pol polyprotein from transposon TNT 1-94 [Vitis vinifera]|uniref:Retrovirus-related Pol polyprotein from transposon TNT 1-94 n=1 Tax=Vitis vinifera TaxID=29760 RepID=A0A438KBI0_VITVI|nr:Retrovirus-related Pol polyprotein from transposon TNT 1-94 [Vitis vinifera]